MAHGTLPAQEEPLHASPAPSTWHERCCPLSKGFPWSRYACGHASCSRCKERGGSPRKASGSPPVGATLDCLLPSRWWRHGHHLGGRGVAWRKTGVGWGVALEFSPWCMVVRRPGQRVRSQGHTEDVRGWGRVGGCKVLPFLPPSLLPFLFNL